MKSVNIGICGLGTVGAGTVTVLSRNKQFIESRAGCELVLGQVGARRDNPDCDLANIPVSRNIFDVVNNPDIHIVVELIGGTTVAKDLVLQAIDNGKHVVTANKALIAEFGNEIFARAVANRVTVAYEAAVAGGIPVIKAIREGLTANRIEWLAGIINGTANFILTEMELKNRGFTGVLKEAQDLGYAEADPTFDVDGIDAAHKLVILASLAFGIPVEFGSVFMEGIGKVETKDIEYAKNFGYRIKHLGIARRQKQGVELRVHPALVPDKRLIANVDGVMNAVMITGDAVGPTLYCGAGAGGEPTASSVIADIVDIARQMATDADSGLPPSGFIDVSPQKILPMSEVVTAWYLRLLVDDKPGVLSQLTTILGNEGISVEAMHQNEPFEGETHAEIVLITSRVKEARLLPAVSALEALAPVQGEIHKIRVESLDWCDSEND